MLLLAFSKLQNYYSAGKTDKQLTGVKLYKSTDCLAIQLVVGTYCPKDKDPP